MQRTARTVWRQTQTAALQAMDERLGRIEQALAAVVAAPSERRSAAHELRKIE